MLEAITRANTTSAKKVETKSQPNVKQSSLCAATIKCHFCHVIYYCKNFVAFSVSQKAAEICKLCVNCLRSSSYASSKCTSDQCKVCQAKHNRLLHMPLAADFSTTHNNTDKEVASKATFPSSVLAIHVSESFSEQVMLSTAIVLVCDSDDSRRVC